MKYGYVRAKSRALIAATSTGLVVIPVTGVVAVTLVSQDEPVVESTTDEQIARDLQYGEALANATVQIEASSDATYEIVVPEIDVEIIPPPAPRVSAPSSNARPVANSADVQAAIDGSAIIAEAAKYVGTAYVHGGSDPSVGFDCSGFTSYIYGKFGISLPRSSSAYYNVGTRVDSPQPGDIIVSSGHVGIYAGPNLQIDAPRPGKTIQFRGIWQSNPVYIRVTG